MPDRRATPPGVIGVSRRPTRREWRGALVFFAVGVAGLILVVTFIHPQPNLLPVGSAAPPVRLQAVGGGVVEASAAAGAPYIVEFFEAGCAHCQQVAAQLCDEKVPVFAVDAARESAATIGSYRQRYAPGCTYPLLLDPDLAVAGAYHVNAVPTVYLVVRGVIRYAGAGLEGVGHLGAAVRTITGG